MTKENLQALAEKRGYDRAGITKNKTHIIFHKKLQSEIVALNELTDSEKKEFFPESKKVELPKVKDSASDKTGKEVKEKPVKKSVSKSSKTKKTR